MKPIFKISLFLVFICMFSCRFNTDPSIYTGTYMGNFYAPTLPTPQGTNCVVLVGNSQPNTVDILFSSPGNPTCIVNLAPIKRIGGIEEVFLITHDYTLNDSIYYEGRIYRTFNETNIRFEYADSFGIRYEFYAANID